MAAPLDINRGSADVVAVDLDLGRFQAEIGKADRAFRVRRGLHLHLPDDVTAVLFRCPRDLDGGTAGGGHDALGPGHLVRDDDGADGPAGEAGGGGPDAEDVGREQRGDAGGPAVGVGHEGALVGAAVGADALPHGDARVVRGHPAVEAAQLLEGRGAGPRGREARGQLEEGDEGVDALVEVFVEGERAAVVEGVAVGAGRGRPVVEDAG